MDNVVYSIFFFIIIPLIYAVFFLDKKSRLPFSCLIVGMIICLISSELNSILLKLCGGDFFFFSTAISPIVEETLKGIPLVFLAFVWFDKDERTETFGACGFALGVGFALFENIITFYQSAGGTSLLWSLARGFGSGLVHGICTAVAGIGISLIRKKKNLYFYSILGLFSATFIYHGLYNCFVSSSELEVLGTVFPTLTYILLFLLYRKNRFFRLMMIRLNNKENQKEVTK